MSESRKIPETHGMTKSAEYRAWQDMRNRCSNSNYYQYEYYGGRGITVCPEWNDSFVAFYKHLGPRPNKQYSLDRIDNSKGYKPGNVRWATKQEQVLNRRMPKNNTSGFTGVSWDKNNKAWVSDLKRNGSTRRVGYFKSPREASLAREQALKQLEGGVL